MSTAMAGKSSLIEFHVDETSCGPLCQHPQCWASNRRCERGLPRVTEPVGSSWDSEESEGALPTLKIQNLLADSGLDTLLGRFPTQRLRQSEATLPSPRHQRSSSAPVVDFHSKPKQLPFTPYTSPLGEQVQSKARSVEVRELFEVDKLHSDWQNAFVPAHVYVWCPSKKAYERQLRKDGEPTTAEKNDEDDVSKSIIVKDMTDSMVPKAPKDKTKRNKKMKKKPSRITPTGGRPYTHPSRSPLIQRRTLPIDMDKSISQLLSLPRDILMDVLVHIQNSESLDKAKVQILLNRLMPLIHFDQNQPSHRALTPTPLLASGILQNKKMSIHEGRQCLGDREQEVTAGPKNPFYLDDKVLSAMTTSTYTAHTQQLPAEEAHQELQETGRMARQQPLGPIQADTVAPLPKVSNLRNKPTSVSTKSLPPLIPGAKPTKPFDYKGAKLLDLTLGPLPSPDLISPEKPSTPRSEKASTLYVTLPSVPSPDRTDLVTPLQPYGSIPGIPYRFANYMRDTPSPIASEDFQPLHAVSPSLSTGVPQAPLGTPATNIYHSSKLWSPSPTKQTNQGIPDAYQRDVNTASGRGADLSNPDALGTIQEVHSAMATSYLDTSPMGTSRMTSPGKHFTLVSTPWGNCMSITASPVSDRVSRSPVPPMTPRPSTATPELWPEVDERDFMTSPEKPLETASSQTNNMTTPTAPPPSPEPQELNSDYDFAVNDMSKSAVTSLTPLVEEGEEEEEEEREKGEEAEYTKDIVAREVVNNVAEGDQNIEEGNRDISVGQEQHTNSDDPNSDILNKSSTDAPKRKKGTTSKDITDQDGTEENPDKTSLELIEPAEGHKDNSDEQYGLNRDTIQEDLNKSDVEEEMAGTTEFVKPGESSLDQEGTTTAENSTDAALTKIESESAVNQGASINPEATNGNTEEKLDPVLSTNEGQAIETLGNETENPQLVNQNTGLDVDSAVLTNEDKSLIDYEGDAINPQSANQNTGEELDPDITTSESQALIASEKETNEDGNVNKEQDEVISEQENVPVDKSEVREGVDKLEEAVGN